LAAANEWLDHLRVVEELGDQLRYVKWSREQLAFLDNAVRDALLIVQQQGSAEPLTSRLAELGRQVESCLHSNQPPLGSRRHRILEALEALHQALPHSVVWAGASDDRPSTPSILRGEMLLLAGPESGKLALELGSAGFHVRRLDTLAALRTTLGETLPAAIVVDLDYSEGALLAGINMVTNPEARFDRQAPLFFFSERGDLAARLEAVSAGGSGYFNKPVNAQALIETLHDYLLQRSVRGYRVLIINDNVSEASRLAKLLESRALVTCVVDQPLEVLRALYQFQPNLLLLDLELASVRGLELALAIRQHETFEGLPMILLSAQPNLNRYQFGLRSGDDLLYKPISAEMLLAAVTYRLHRAQTLLYRLTHLSQRDTVSSLFNRRYFLNQLNSVLRNASQRVAVMLISLDNLADIEGRDIGAADAVIEDAARRLTQTLEPGWLAARFSDTVFSVLLNLNDHRQLARTAQTLRQVLESEPYQRGSGESLQIQASVGISIATDEERDGLRLLQQAELAGQIARRGAADAIHIHHPQTDQEAVAMQQQQLLEDIHEAVQQRRMNLVFQPIVSLRGDTTARYEVLLRLRNRRGEDLLPELVFSVAQQHKAGLVLERWVIANSIRLLRAQQASKQNSMLFVNISPTIIHDQTFVESLKVDLDRTRVNAGRLVFEVTEANAQQHLVPLRKFLEAVKALGCGFSLQRFGGEDYSWTLLRNLTVDYVKLNADFVQDLPVIKEKQEQLRKLVKEMEGMHINTIASSIENLATLQALRSCGLNYAQGYFLQRPSGEMTYDFATHLP
jgi:diguanylate cyclase (GGDEF)-like protein